MSCGLLFWFLFMIAFIDAVMVFMDDFVVVGVDDLLDDLFLLMLF